MVFKKLFNTLRSDSVKNAHMTWAKSTYARSITHTAGFLKRQVWIFPILAIVALSILAYFVRGSIESTMKENLKSQLQTLLNVEKEMLITWLEVQESNAESQANNLQVRSKINELIKLDSPLGDQATDIKTTPLHNQLYEDLNVAMSTYDYVGYFVADKNGKILSSTDQLMIGEVADTDFEVAVSKCLNGQNMVSVPFPSAMMLKDEFGEHRTGVPTMFTCAPVRDDNYQIIAVIGFQIRPESEFTRILQLGRIGSSGETYAFNQSGVMVSNSRFDEDLILLGLLPDQDKVRSLLKIQVRDPGGNMLEGHRPGVRRKELPLTKMCASATSGKSEVDVTGYNDYRGVPVIGAWTWLDKYDFGITSEIDCAEAFQPLIILQWTFWTLYVLLAICSIAIFVFTLIVAKMRREAQKAAIENQKLGQYTLEQKIGSGAMGVVYKGFHAILRRPTAIKLLNLDKINDSTIERFEREVQITSQLNNPHTISIYDYGRTEEGVFYYAMEYLDGIDLQELVDNYGPISEGRTIRILLQMCSSLHEAHMQGLVHRDIKPANIMLNRRGGEPDVVKVLDFGLVKAIDQQKQSGATLANSLTGTPLYMSPEAIQTPDSVDNRSDLYAVGAVGYYLLTGKPVFDAENLVELCQMHVSKSPMPPSERIDKDISEEVENTILACLHKSRAKRPQTARDIIQMLLRSKHASDWSIEEADLWWGRHERGIKVNEVSRSLSKTTFSSTKSQTTDMMQPSQGNELDQTIVSSKDAELPDEEF